jgi:hypothetical protein
MRVLSQARGRELQLLVVQSMLGDGVGARRLLPTQSISGHGVRDGRHVVVGSAPPEPRLLRIASQPLGSLGQTVCLPGLVWRNGASTLALMLSSIAARSEHRRTTVSLAAMRLEA